MSNTANLILDSMYLISSLCWAYIVITFVVSLLYDIKFSHPRLRHVVATIVGVIAGYMIALWLSDPSYTSIIPVMTKIVMSIVSYMTTIILVISKRKLRRR